MSHKTELTRQITYFIHILKLFFHLHYSIPSLPLSRALFRALLVVRICFLFRDARFSHLFLCIILHFFSFFFQTSSRTPRVHCNVKYQVHARLTQTHRHDALTLPQISGSRARAHTKTMQKKMYGDVTRQDPTADIKKNPKTKTM